MSEIVKQIEDGDINWDNVYSIKIIEEEIPIVESFASLKDGNQGALKVNLNSEFGALDNEYFVVNNRNISGSITFMGRLLNRLTGDNIERYMKEKYGDGQYICYQDTDSLVHSSKIKIRGLYKVTLDSGEVRYVDKKGLEEATKIEEITEISIGELYSIIEENASHQQISEIKDEKFVIKCPFDITTPSVNGKNELEFNKLIYIMEHNTEKELFEILVNGKSVIVTKDHSCIVLRDNILTELKPEDIKSSDIFLTLDENEQLVQETNFEIKSLGKTREKVYDIEVEDNHNFFANDILVHNSGYIHFQTVVEKIMQKEFGISSDEFDTLSNENKKKAVDFMLDFIDNEIQPIIDETVDFVLKKFNGFKKGFMGAKVEKVAQSGFWTAKKRYALLVLYDEGAYKIEKPKIGVTGLETIKSQTPDYAIEILEQGLKIVLQGTEKELQEFLDSKKGDFIKVSSEQPQLVCEVVKINNLTYDLDEKGYFRINENGKRIGAPMNSKAGMAYNRILEERQLQEYYIPIEAGMKSYIAKLRTPNPAYSDVIAFLDDAFLIDTGLNEYVDGEHLWEKHVKSPMKAIAEAVDYSLEYSVSSLDDW